MPNIDRAGTERVHRSATREDEPYAPTQTTTQQASDRALASRVERLPIPSDYAAFVAHVAATARIAPPEDPSLDAAIRAKLDAVRDAFSGPYVVDGHAVTARPMFRMTTHDVPLSLALAVDQLAMRAGVKAPFATRVGQGTPQDLVKITQALIDHGRLPPGPGDVATRIRRMQWDYGIGVDCAGYCKQALLASAARTPTLYAPGMESFRHLDRDRPESFARIAIASARPGDLVTLDPAPPEGWGHNVMVYSRVVADVAKRAELAAFGAEARAFFASAGPHHVLEVDSSWGAGANGSEEGGFRRDTWVFDTSTKSWGSFAPGARPPRFVSSSEGPAGDRYHATYRPR
jgi:hypothetical protein